MYTCQTCQAQLLDHLYGLLDDTEAQAVRQHLDGCAPCRGALTRAQQQQQVLAYAAKGHFPGVRFEPPAAQPTAQPAPQPTGAREEAPTVLAVRPRRWGRLALAAGLLLTAGLGVVAGVQWYGYGQEAAQARAERDRTDREQTLLAQRQQQERERTRRELAAIQEEIRLLEARWTGEVTKVKTEFAGRGEQVTVTGPRTLQAGAPNVYLFERHPTAPPRARPRPMTARVLDAATNSVLASRSLDAGFTRWELPQTFEVKPGAQLTLEVTEEGEPPALTAGRTLGASVSPLGPTPLNAVVALAAREREQPRISEALQLIGTLYVTHLTTDRPMYRPGEVVRFRSLTLERFGLKPAQQDFQLRYRITDPRGAELFKQEGPARVAVEKGKPDLPGPDGKALKGLGAGEFRIPPGAAGGEYSLTVTEAQGRFPPERRKFLVNNYQPPRLNKEIEFTRKSYGPGDAVEALCKVARAEGGLPADGERVVASVQVDGQHVPVVDEGALILRKGEVTVRFRLPANLERGDGSLSVKFVDGGVLETIVRPVPIVVNKLFVEFFPEGGDLVAGLPNRVYFTARTPLGKPAELEGKLLEDGKEVADLRTLNDDKEPGVNQGMGMFEFTPKANKTYSVRVDSPLGIKERPALPAVKGDGVVLAAPGGVFTDRIDAVVRSAQQRKLFIGAYCRGRLLDHTAVTVKPGEATPVKLTPAQGVGGVYRITVFEERGGQQLVPLAERLVYRRPTERLDLKVKADGDDYTPGSKVGLTLEAKDEKARRAPFIALVSVVDLSVLKLADEKTARSMPTHFFLTTEVRQPEDLEYADFLVGEHPKAAAALDLLLGTQGWRRFAEQQKDPKDLEQFRRKQKQDADRLLLASGGGQPERKNLLEVSILKVDNEFAPKHVEGQRKLAAREAQDDEREKLVRQEQAALNQQAQQRRAAAVAAQANLSQFRSRLLTYTLIGLAAALLIYGVVGFTIGLVRMSNQQRNAVGYFASGLASLMILFVFGAGALVFTLGGREGERRMALMGGPMEVAKAEFGGPPPPMAAMPDRGPRDDFFGGDKGPEMKKAAEPAPKAMPPEPFKEDKRPEAPQAAPKPVAPIDPQGVQVQPVAGQVKQVPGNDGLALAKPEPPPFGRLEDIAPEQPRMPPMDRPGWMGGEAGRPRGGDDFFRERELRRQGRFDQVAQLRLGLDRKRAALLPVLTEPLVVREYAHKHLPARDGVRSDFTETLYWHPVLVVPSGKTEAVHFDLSDSVTRFQVVVWAHTLDGRLGASTTEVASKLPFSIDPTVPVEVTRNDKITLPVTVANDTAKSLSVEVAALVKNLNVLGESKRGLALEAGKRGRQLFTFQPSVIEGEATLRLSGQAEGLRGDAIEKRFKIVPEGFPFVGAKSDLLENVATHEITLPETWVPGTLKLRVEVFPSTLADLQKGLESMLREPGGCFEQSSSSNYPNVLILNYMKESDQTDAQVEARARQLLTSGYRQLTSFECMDPSKTVVRRGYEWFGQTAPPHEALTAYGLLQFRDMARVHPVDAAMMERTKKYLLAQRDGKGGFKRNPRALDSFGRAPDHVTSAYIVWALTDSGAEEDLSVELKALHTRAKDSKDPYFVALVAIGHLNRGKTDEGLALLRKLRDAQKEDGRMTGAQTSITGSGGRDLDIETTALATLGWLRANRPADFNPSVQKAVKWIGQQRGGYGGFGSTQSTILALKALIDYTKENKKIPHDSDLVLEVNGKVAGSKKFAAGTRDGLSLSLDDTSALKPGKNTVRVTMEKNSFPHTLTWEYRTLKPANADTCPVKLTTKLDRDKADEGDTVRLSAVVENASGKGQGMAVAILGLPAGLELPPNQEQLKNMARLRDEGTREGEISAYEVLGRELVLYWRDLAPGKRIEVNVDLICRVPGEYRGPASRAYLYYNADQKFWAEPLTVSIAPKVQ